MRIGLGCYSYLCKAETMPWFKIFFTKYREEFYARRPEKAFQLNIWIYPLQIGLQLFLEEKK